MLKFKHIGVLYQAADSWDEVQLRHLQLIGKELPARELLALWCNVPIGTFSHAKDIDTILSTALAFLIAPCPEWEPASQAKDISDLTVQQVFDLNNLLDGNEGNIQAVADILTITGDYIESMPYRVALPLAKEYIKQLSAFNERWSKEMPHEATAAEKQADPRKLNKFGLWGTVLRMAGNPSKMEAIWQLPYGRFYNAVRHDYEQSQYQQRLHRIISESNRPKK